MTAMTSWYDFSILALGFACWSPSTFARSIGGKVRQLNFSSVYVLTTTGLAISSALFSPVSNMFLAHTILIDGVGLFCALLAAFVTSRIDRSIVRKFFGLKPLPTKSSIQRDAEVVSSSYLIFLEKVKVAHSIRTMSLLQLIIVGAGEEFVFRVGVPISSTRGTCEWFLLTLLGTVLFTYSHHIFGKGQIISKLPLAVSSLLLFWLWGIWACVVCHACYNIIYWRTRKTSMGELGSDC